MRLEKTKEKIEVWKTKRGRFKPPILKLVHEKINHPLRTGEANPFLPQRKQKLWGPKPHTITPRPGDGFERTLSNRFFSKSSQHPGDLLERNRKELVSKRVEECLSNSQQVGPSLTFGRTRSTRLLWTM